MGIEATVAKFTVQTAVYWGAPIPDGFGQKTFTNPVEISCRWDDITELIMNRHGVEIASQAQLIVTTDINVEGYLYLGTLASLEDAEQLDPKLVATAYPVQKFEKSPEFKSTDKFVRIVYL